MIRRITPYSAALSQKLRTRPLDLAVPFRSIPLTTALLFSAGSLIVLPSHSAQAQGGVTAKQKQLSLETRLQKAVAIYNAAGQALNANAVFDVYGKVKSGDGTELVIYGKSIPHNQAANDGLGSNTDDSFLTIYHADTRAIRSGQYSQLCWASSQTEFRPVSASYIETEAIFHKYEEIIESLRAEIAAKRNAQSQALRRQEQARLDKIEAGKKAQRDSVYKSRLALADREASALLSKLDSGIAAVSDKGAAHSQASSLALGLFNKWGALGVSNRALLNRSYNELVEAISTQLERDDWKGVEETATRLLSLELMIVKPDDAKSGRERSELRPGQMPSNTVSFVMQRSNANPSSAKNLAEVWTAKLPLFIAGNADQQEKIRVANLSQLLAVCVFPASPDSNQIVATAIDDVRGAYGPGSLAVIPSFVSLVDQAKRVRVAQQESKYGSEGSGDFEDNVIPPRAAPAKLKVSVPVGEEADKPLLPAVDFGMRSLRTGRKSQLSDYRGKTIVLYFWGSTDEGGDMSPTPGEKLTALAKRYDPAKVVLLLVDESVQFDYAAEQYPKSIDPSPNAIRDHNRGHGPRLYPAEAFSLVMGRPVAAGDVPAEQVIAENALSFYTGSKNPSWNAMRVTVINPQQMVVGAVDFKEDLEAQAFNARQNPGGAFRTFDFNEDALEDLLVKALAAPTR